MRAVNLRTITRLAILLVVFSAASQAALTDKDSYAVVHGWPELPAGRTLGQAAGVGVDSHNHVFVFHRAGREWSDPFPAGPIEAPTVMVFDGDTGKKFVMPHGLSVDAWGMRVQKFTAR